MLRISILVLMFFARLCLANEKADEGDTFVDELNGRITRDLASPGKPIVEICLWEATDSVMLRIGSLPRLVKLNISGSEVSDAGLKRLTSLSHLEELDLGGTLVTDAGLKSLSTLIHLRDLSLGSTKITDAGIKELLVHKKLK